MIQDTSIKAYYEVLRSLGRSQKEVLDALRTQPNATNAEIAHMLHHRPINTITPRVFELRQIGLVEEVGKRKCRVTSRTAIAWRAVPMPSAKPPEPENGSRTEPLF
jgi:Mn-dependent DtxR family transcriptional regulator